MKYKIILTAVLLLLCSQTIAAGATGERYTRSAKSVVKTDDQGWSGSVGIGALVTSGNSETTNLNTDIKLKLELERFRHNFLVAALFAENDNEKTAEKYLLGYKIDYKLTSFSYLFADFRAEFDEFSGFDRQTSETVGYGRRLIDTAADTLDLEGGIGVRQNKFSTGDTETEAVLRGAVDYLHKFSDASEFRQGVLVLAGEDNTSIDTVSAIKTKIVGNLSLEAALKVKHNTDPPADKKETDTSTSLSLAYSF